VVFIAVIVTGTPYNRSSAIKRRSFSKSAISNLKIDPSSQSSHDTGLLEAEQDLITAIRDVRTSRNTMVI